MADEEEKDEFDEDDLFTNPDEEDYQFDQDETESTSETSDEYASEDEEDDDEDEEYEESSFVDQIKQKISQIIRTIKEDDPRKVLVPVGIAIFSFIVIIYGFVKFIGLFTASKPHTKTAAVSVQPTIQPAPQPIAPPTENAQPETPTSEQPQADESQKPDNMQEPSEGSSEGLNPISAEQPTESSTVPVVPKTGTEKAQALQKMMAMQAALDSRLANVENNYSNTMGQLNQLSQQVAQNSAQMNNFSQNIQMLESQVMKINNVLMDLLSEAKKKQAAEAEKAAHFEGARRDDTPELMYYIQAIIPGRGWIKDSNGKIFTVTTGDLIPEYGRVVEIDPKKGLIRTDQGRAIEYGIDQF